MGRRLAAALALALALVCAGSASAKYAPLNQPGPKLRVSKPDLRASLQCTGNVRNAKRKPVLLLPGTTVNSQQNFSWNYEPALSARHIPWCASDAPGLNMEDIQVRGEYVVFAIRRMHAMAHRRIAIYGHSQGGMVGRWALRFWPGTRRMVSDVIGAAPSNQGTDVALAACLPGCAPSVWQQRSRSSFNQALNSRAETFRGISYTNIYTHTDEIVFPNLDGTGRSSLHTGKGRITNVAVQDACPLDVADHLIVGTQDAVTWELFRDALNHNGPAKPDRLPPGTCTELLMPGVNPATYVTDSAAAYTALGETFALYPHSSAEPKLRGYTQAS